LELVTRLEDAKDRETYMEWIARIVESGNQIAIEVKRADLEDHMDPVSGHDFEGASSLMKRYMKAMEIIKGA